MYLPLLLLLSDLMDKALRFTVLPGRSRLPEKPSPREPPAKEVLPLDEVEEVAVGMEPSKRSKAFSLYTSA